MRLLIAPGQGQQAKNMLNSGKDRCVIIHAMVNDSPWNQGRYNNGGNPHSQLCKIKRKVAIFWIGRRISRSDGLWRRHMIIKSPVLIIGDDEHAAFPVGRGSDRLVNRLEKRLASCDVVFWMLRIAAHEVQRRVIVRLDKGIGRGIARIMHISAEVLKVSEASFGGANSHAAYSQRLWKWISMIDSPIQAFIVEPIKDGSIVKFIAVEEDGTGYICRGWTVIQAP